MNSIGILLTDHQSINESIILKSVNKIKNSRLKLIFFIGDKKKFPKLFNKVSKLKKCQFIHVKNRPKSFDYLNNILNYALRLFKSNKIKYVINMPIDKKKFLINKYPGFTEMFSQKIDNKKNENMLLFSQNFSVCPVTTHIPLNEVNAKINYKIVNQALKNIDNFYKKRLKKKIKLSILGMNPHASKDFSKKNKDNQILKKIVKNFKKKKIDIEGPLSADTAFKNYKNKVYIGMYHDQVLIPFKLINKFNGINITIGKKYIRLSPDHGTGVDIFKKNKKINTLSFRKCIEFCEKY